MNGSATPNARLEQLADAEARPFTVFVTVGTDHHRFDRLVRWADTFAMKRPDAHIVVQYGNVSAPLVAEGESLMSRDRMVALCRNADAIVCHGGPATIVEIRDLGRLPVVVPRRASLDEHVDDHQVRFTARLAEMGRVLLPESEADLVDILESARLDPTLLRVESDEVAIGATVRLLADLIDAVVG